jgi:hypothetical protein
VDGEADPVETIARLGVRLSRRPMTSSSARFRSSALTRSTTAIIEFGQSAIS